MNKRILISTLIALSIFGYALSFAAETTFSGSYRVRSLMDNNWQKKLEDPPVPVGPFLSFFPTHNHPLYTGYFDQRFRLTITHTRSEFLKAVVTLDLVEDTWGQSRALRINNDTVGSKIHQAYIEFLIPNVGLFTLGTKDQRWGMGTYLDSGGVIVNYRASWAVKVNNVIAALMYTKYSDAIDNSFNVNTWPGRPGLDAAGGPGSVNYNADMDAYTMTVMYLTDRVSVGALFQANIDLKGISFPFTIKGASGFADFNGEFPDPNPVVQANWPYPPVGFGTAGMYRFDVYSLGFFWDLDFLNGMLAFKGEVDRIWGVGNANDKERAYNAFLSTLPIEPGRRLSNRLAIDGLNIYADLVFHYDILTVGLAFLYGSGEKWWSGITQEHYNFNTGTMNDFSWSNIIVSGNPELLGSTVGRNSPLGLGNNQENITSAKVYWSITPTESLDIHGAFIWAKYTNPVGRDARFGDPAFTRVPGWNVFYGHPMNYTHGTYTYIPAGISDDLGWEVDLGLSWMIMEGLSISSEFGVLFAGSAFDYRNSATGARERWGDIYRWTNTVTYEF
jgi:hypothetical protein